MNTFFRFFTTAIIAITLGGCSGTTKTPSPASPPAAAEADTSKESSSLAEMAQRDVDAFLNRRRDATSSASDEEPAPSPSRQEIIWNDGSNDTSPPQPTVELPEVQQSPLFLAADDRPESQPTDEPFENASDGIDLESDRVRELIIDLSKELYRDAAHADMPLRELFLIAATTLVSPDRELNPDAIPGLTARERDVLREFQQFFVHLGSSLDGSSDAEEIILGSIETLRAALRTDPQLTLGTYALCTRVGGFGDFDPFNRYAFLAHSEQQAVVYIEIAGFTSELNERDEWVTELSQQLTIYSDRDGIPVWREDWQSAADRSRNKRQDFFVVQLITLPRALSVGRYHLKIRVRDEKSGAEAEGTIPFEMVADPKMAATVR